MRLRLIAHEIKARRFTLAGFSLAAVRTRTLDMDCQLFAQSAALHAHTIAPNWDDPLLQGANGEEPNGTYDFDRDLADC
jgi:hypothetical protein